MFLLVLSLLSFPSPSSTLIVDSSGGGNYLTIQAAIDASLPGDLILVMPGTYVEDLAVRESVTIRADTPGSVLIYPATHDPGVGFGSQVTTTTQCCSRRFNF